MNTSETQRQILESEDFVLRETKKLQYFYGLKREIRYKLERTIGDYNESVADHVYGMHIIAKYFLPLEDPDQTWDWQKVYEIITWHDTDEIETGDTISYLKTDQDRAEEAVAMQRVLDQTPTSIQTELKDLLDDYEHQRSREAQFVKAVDKIEPQFHLYNQEGKNLIHEMKSSFAEHKRIKHPYIDTFPYIRRFSEVLSETMKAEGFFLH